MTKPFDCSACGACCRRVSVVPGWPLREDGACYFLQADNKCGIYETRPAICRVDESRPAGMDVVTWHRLNADACKRLQDEETPLAAPLAPRLPPGMTKPDMPFAGFPKISRLSRLVLITEKIDGTNAQIYIDDAGEVFAGSRNRWITPEDDNYGFARWVEDNKDELRKLGPGQHFGEWWGAGIQRRYGMTEKVFSLFNVKRWADDAIRPACCRVVPTLFAGSMENLDVRGVMADLVASGSRAAPGFMDPEGIVLFHTASGTLFKKTCKDDEKPKGVVANT